VSQRRHYASDADCRPQSGHCHSSDSTEDWGPLGYLYDIGSTRDVWLHRVDLSRAIGRTIDATAQHDGRIVADIIAEWATTHSDPFTLRLTGPAGGTYVRDSANAGDCLELDAIECCRLLSGRGTPVGVLHHPLFL
jgi:hypothetical protein